jgi:ornithine cyclodeaminase
MSLLVLSAADVREVVSTFSTTYLQDLMGRVFVSISQAEVNSTSGEAPDIQTPHRTAIYMTSHTTLFMPARISCNQPSYVGTSIKVVSVPRRPDDTRGLPATTLVLNEETGAVEAVINARELTALRNAAGPSFSSLVEMS